MKRIASRIHPLFLPHPRRVRRASALALTLAVSAGSAPITAAPVKKKAPARTPSKASSARKMDKTGAKIPATSPPVSTKPQAGSVPSPATSPTVAPSAPAGSAKPAAPGMPTPDGAPVPVLPASVPPGPPPTPAAKLPPGMIKLDFRGTEVDSVLQAYALAYKWTVVKDPGLSGPVTIIETTPMDQKRAFLVLQAVLEVRGFAAILDGSILKIMPIKKAISSARTVRVPQPEQEPLEQNQVLTEVISLSNAEASVLAKDLQPLLTEGASLIGAAGANALIVTDHSANIDKLKTVIGALDKGAGNNEMEIFRLKHVPAKQMSEIINNLFKQIAPRTPPAPMGQPGQPIPPPQPGRPGAQGEARPAVAAVDDTRTNSVIVVGSTDNLKRVAELVHKLDEELNPHTETKVYEVKYAEAQRLAQLVNDALLKDPSAPSQSQQPSSPFGFFNPFERRAQGTQTTSFSAGQTRIVADTRANKLVITADEDVMKVVEDLLAQLDMPVEYETTTFVIKLRNQHAEDMAYVLAQAFGTQQQSFGGFGFFGGFFGNNNRGNDSRRDRRIPRRLNNDQDNRSDAGGPGGRFAGIPEGGFSPAGPGGTRIADAGGRPPLPEGAEQLAQFFYDYYGRGNRGSDATTGRTSDGKYVNLLQLRGNVLVNAERNTNSLIITTTPENAQAVRELVEDLDIETKQVLLEAIVAEVTLDKANKFGIDYLFDNLRDKFEGVFPVLPGTGPLGSDPLTSGLRATILRGDFRVILTAIGRDERVKILSTPSVFTSNNQEAEIDVTDRIPYLGGTTVGFGGQTQTSTTFQDVGLILNVTPRITAEGMVTVDVYQEDSNLIEFRNIGQNTIAPVTTQRVTDTSVTLRDGDTLVLSGLQKDAETRIKNKIPVLGDLPLIGNLFRSNTRQNRRTELLVFLTPRVVHTADEARALTQEELEKLKQRIPAAKTVIPNNGEPRGPELERLDLPKKDEGGRMRDEK